MRGNGQSTKADDRSCDDAAITGGGEGGDDLLEALYRAERPRLIRYLARRTADRQDAQDMVQEAFFRIVRRNAEGGRVENSEAYLNRTARNLLRDRAKFAARRSMARHVPLDEQSLAGADQHGLLEARDMLSRVEKAMQRLRPKTREIFMAHRIDGLSYAEIADRMGMSVKAVEKQMSRAIAKLDRLLSRP